MKDARLLYDEDFGMAESIYWVTNENIDGTKNYTGFVLEQIVRPGKYQLIALGKEVRYRGEKQ